MADLRVDIKTTADLSGANAATDALKATTAAAAGLADSSKTATQATEDTSDALKQTSQATDTLGDSLADTARKGEEAGAALKQAASASTAAADASNTAAKAATNLGGGLSDMIRRGSPAHELFDGLARGSLESSSGILALTRAVTGLFRGISSGGVGLLVTGLAAAAGAAVLFTRNMGDAAKSTEDAKKKFDEAKRSADALGQTELGQLNSALQKVEAQAQRDTKAFNELNTAKEKVANADQALRLAQIQNDPRLSNEQKITAEIKTRADFQRAADARELAASAQKVQEAKTVAQAASDNLIAPEAQLKAFDAETDRLKGIREQRLQTEADILEARRKADIALPSAPGPGGSLISGGDSSPTVRALQKKLDQSPEASPEQIKLSEAQADSARKVVEAGREKARIDNEALADAQKAYEIQKDTQKTVRAITTETTRVTAQPDLVKARQTDREVKVQAANDRSNPAADKLQSTLQNLDDQIKSLRDQANNNLRSSRDPENQRLNAQADALQGQRDNTQSAFDTASRLPTKADIKRTDSSAAKTDADKALKIDTQPIEDAEKKNQAEILKAQQADNAAIKSTAVVIAAQPPIPPLDLAPVREATISYNGQNLLLHKSTQAQLVAFGKQIRDQQSQIDALSRAQSQQN